MNKKNKILIFTLSVLLAFTFGMLAQAHFNIKKCPKCEECFMTPDEACRFFSENLSYGYVHNGKLWCCCINDSWRSVAKKSIVATKSFHYYKPVVRR